MKPNLVVIGGGTGSFTLLKDLKNWTPNITAVVNMSDDGGSSGQLRDEFGVLPPGDIRQCLVALSNNPETRDLFSYRFGGDGNLEGHPVGNIILTALELQYDSFTKAIDIVAEFLRITGQVVTVSNENYTLAMNDGDQLIEGEHKITEHTIANKGAKVFLEPKAKLNPKAKMAIQEADMVVIAPGNLFGSLLPTLSVEGMSEALKQTKAKTVMVANLVNKPKQTLNWHVADYVSEMEKYIGNGVIDYVLYNSKPPTSQLLNKYAEDNEFPVKTSQEEFMGLKAKPIGASLIASRIYKADKKDKAIRRTLIRHDAYEVTKQLKKLLKN